MQQFDEMKLARIIDAAGGIDGRVKMQKIVYLLSTMGFDVPFRDFAIQRHGPFSRAIACAADIVNGAGFVEETANQIGEKPSGEPVVRFSYRVRPDLSELLRKHFSVRSSNENISLEAAASELNGRPTPVLEVTATKVFLEQEDGLTGDELENELRRLKGHLASSFSEADELLEEFRRRKWL